MVTETQTEIHRWTDTEIHAGHMQREVEGYTAQIQRWTDAEIHAGHM